jgi:hypothetical protein
MVTPGFVHILDAFGSQFDGELPNLVVGQKFDIRGRRKVVMHIDQARPRGVLRAQPARGQYCAHRESREPRANIAPRGPVAADASKDRSGCVHMARHYV